MKASILRIFAFLLVSISVSACMAPLAVNYSASSALSQKGNVNVSNFSYTPALEGKVKPNQIQNSALGSLNITDNIDTFITNAVKVELKNIGYNINSGDIILSGEIVKLHASDIGYSIDWSYDVIYKIEQRDGKTLITKPVSVAINANKFVNIMDPFPKLIRQSLEQFISDESVKKILK